MTLAGLRTGFQYWFGIFMAAARNWLGCQSFALAGALAFFTLFSIAPVMIIALTITGFFLGSQAAEGRIMEQLQDVVGPEAAEVIEMAVMNSRIETAGLWPTVIGVVLIVIGSTTVFAQMQKALNTLWGVAPRPSKNSIWILVKARVLSLTIVLAIGFVLLVSLLLSVALRAIMAFAEQWLPMPGWAMVSVELIVSLTVVTLLFGAMFRILPDVNLGWRDVLLGALITAGLFTLGRSLIAMYLANTATASTYGAAGSLVLLLLWVYFSSLILLYGAAFTRAHLEARGKRIVPRNTAVLVHRELIEDAPAQKGFQ